MKRSRIYSKRQQRSLGTLNGYIEESMEGQMVMQLFNHETEAEKDFQVLNQDYRKNSQKAQITSIMMFPLMQNVNTISYAIIGIVGGYLAINHGLSIGDLGAYVNMTRTQGKPINEISSQFTTLQSAIASAERIFELLDWMVPVKRWIYFNHFAFFRLKPNMMIHAFSNGRLPVQSLHVMNQSMIIKYLDM
ncbi:ABC transporter transmembrane domain-containing protein [Erysipelothrix piscisicarius]